MNGLLLCTRYAFAPNFYLYCGPDKNQALKNFLQEKATDDNIASLLTKFSTLYSYLKAIAHANGIANPLDPKVVEAYWIGNSLLENVPKQAVYRELTEGQKLPKRLPKKLQRWLYPKINQGAKLHHSFHVFNVFVRTGHHTVEHTINTIDQCRIGWGKVTSSKNASTMTVKTQEIIYIDGKLHIKDGTIRVIQNPTQEKLKKGELITYHWGWYCGKITKQQAKQLEKYTCFHLELANQTL